jgi:hypothetical protein
VTELDEPDLNHEEAIATLSLRMIERLWLIQLREAGFNHAAMCWL